MVFMRHKDFATTLKFYGAKRPAQSGAAEIHQKLVPGDKKSEVVGENQKLPSYGPRSFKS